ncbi:MAG: hypothetical protein ABIY56_00220, partial [Dokdonella sp.]
LLASNQPRDHALGASLRVFEVAATDRKQAVTTAPRQAQTQPLHQAARDATNDVVVQWLAALSPPSSAEAIATLQQREPDNAAVWLLALTRASESDDPALRDDALARMAASTHFDEHFGDIVHAWIEVYTRFPPMPAQHPGLSSDDVVTMALAHSFGIATPAYSVLMQTCRPLADADVKPDEADMSRSRELRSAQCERIGRLMLNTADTMMTRTIGYVVLQSLGQDRLSEADRAMKRDLSWYTYALAEEIQLDEHPSAMDAFSNDWRSQRSEIEVITRALRRAGLAVTAPADWVNPFPG